MARALALLVFCLGLTTACQKDGESAQADGAARADAAPVDAAPAEPVPVAPETLAASLPRPPPPSAAAPGDPVSSLRSARPGLKPSIYSDKVLVESFADGPAGTVTYLLSPEGEHVAAVVISLSAPYQHPQHREGLLTSFQQRLGKAERHVEPDRSRHAWSLPTGRVELRHDTRRGGVDLYFHTRGATDLGLR